MAPKIRILITGLIAGLGLTVTVILFLKYCDAFHGAKQSFLSVGLFSFLLLTLRPLWLLLRSPSDSSHT